MGESLLCSAQSFLDYRQGQFARSRQRALTAMEADLALEQSDSFAILEIHRIQGAQNIVRIDLRAGLITQASGLAGSIIGYLENLRNCLPVHHTWLQQTLQRLPRSIRRSMVTQTANEMALHLARAPDFGAWKSFYAGLELTDDWKGSTALHPRVRQWAQLRQAFEQRDWSCYLDLLFNFLPAGREELSPIWYSTVIDLARYCEEEGSRAALQVRRGILQDAKKWPALPAALRPSVDRSAQQSTAITLAPFTHIDQGDVTPAPR
jgi:hypothetical protein